MSRIPSLSSSVSTLSGVPSFSLSGSRKLGIPSPSRSPSIMSVNAGVPCLAHATPVWPMPVNPDAGAPGAFTLFASALTKLTPPE